jgi:hypothetical protein
MDVIKDERRSSSRINMKKAIVQCADTGPLESLVIMLRSIGYQCYTPSKSLRDELQREGCDTVLSIATLVNEWGYDPPMNLPEANPSMMDKCDLFVDIKAHRSYSKIVNAWPRLKDRILWYRINGGKPEHVINDRGDHGDEINPPCPVLTPNQWYKESGPWSPKAYACWPPFYRFDEYLPKHSRNAIASPMCLVHNLKGWGYGALIENFSKLGIGLYGLDSPNGLINHREIPHMLSRALCYIHLKSSDAPGYALYEALAAGCPVICTRRLIWRCNMQSLFSPGNSCLVYDRETHEGLSDKDVEECTREVKQHIETFKDPRENARIGMNGRNRLKEVMWNETSQHDHISFERFMARHFP